MARRDEAEGNPLQVLVPTILIICAIGFVLHQSMGELDRGTMLTFAAVVAVIVYLLTLVNIDIGIATMILCIGLSPEFSVAGLDNLRLEDLVVPVLTIAWLSRHLERREELVPSPLKAPILAYLGISLLSALFGSTVESYNIKHAMFVFGKMCIYFLIYLIVLNNSRTQRQFKAYVILLILVTAISGLGSLAIAPAAPTRLMGPYGETGNIFGGYLAMSLAVVIGLASFLGEFRQRFALMVVGGVTLYPFLITHSRTSYLALAIAFVVFAILRARRFLVWAVMGLLLFPILAPDSAVNRAVTIGSILSENPDPSFAARVDEWKRDLTDYFPQSPLLGRGLGSINLGDVDNEYMRVLVDSGSVGLLAFAWLLLAVLRMGFRSFDQLKQDPFLRGYGAGFAISAIVIIVHGLGATSFTSIRTMESFMVLAALATSLYVNGPQWEGNDEPERNREYDELYAGASR